MWEFVPVLESGEQGVYYLKNLSKVKIELKFFTSS
jgi:hypothetical protein